jgi:hypothetical protein
MLLVLIQGWTGSIFAHFRKIHHAVLAAGNILVVFLSSKTLVHAYVCKDMAMEVRA